MNLIKKRMMKMSNRGIYIQDKELIDSAFKVGSKFKYTIDINNRKLIIQPSKKGNTVSKRAYNGGIKSVIDIRSKEVIETFKGSNYLQMEIENDKIIIRSYDKPEELKNKVHKEVICSKEEFKKITSEQLEFDFIIPEYPKEVEEGIKTSVIPLTLASIFSGAGLMDKGFIEDFEIVFALEKDSDACKTYRKNIGSIVESDITTYDKCKIPGASVLIGGSPCQGFSNSNRNTNYLDNPKNLLVKEYIKSVKAVDPQIFVLENVPQILTCGNGKFFEEIKAELGDYEITKGILDAVDFGVAQKRKRAIIIGSKIGKIELPKPKKSVMQTVKDAFKGLSKLVPNQFDYSKPRDITLQRIKSVLPGQNINSIPLDIRPKGTHSDMYKRLEWDKPSCTIVNVRKSMILHPSEDRILSVRECARLQGANDDFIFEGTLASKQQQIANSVPVKMMKAISSVIKNAINTYNSKRDLVY